MYTSLTIAALAALRLFAGCAAQNSRCPLEQYDFVPSSQRPSTRNCETLGSLAAPSLIGEPLTATSQSSCIATCKRTAGCLSLGYASDNSTCTLYNKRLIDMKYRQRTVDMGVQFSNQLCYKCAPLACPNNQAVTNGGFESGDGTTSATNWTFIGNQAQGATFVRDGDEAFHTGQYAVILHREPRDIRGSIDPLRLNQVLDCVNVGIPYTVSAFVTYDPYVKWYMFLDDQVVYEGPMDCSKSDTVHCSRELKDYQQISGTVTPRTPQPTLTIQAEFQVFQDAFLDDVSMTFFPTIFNLP